MYFVDKYLDQVIFFVILYKGKTRFSEEIINQANIYYKDIKGKLENRFIEDKNLIINYLDRFIKSKVISYEYIKLKNNDIDINEIKNNYNDINKEYFIIIDELNENDIQKLKEFRNNIINYSEIIN